MFIGRTEQLKKYQMRYYDIDAPIPNCVVASGLNSIGRRKFLRHALIDSNVIRAEYLPPIITLDNRCSIEDFIIRIYGLGYSNVDQNQMLGQLDKSLNEKVEIARVLLQEIEQSNNILFIEDNYAIVARDGCLPEWFILLIDKLSTSDNIVMCLLSLSKIRNYYTIAHRSIFSLEIPELEKTERLGLFTSLLKIYKTTLKRKDILDIAEQFKGFPEQIFYTVEILRTEGLQYLLSNLHQIIEYNTDKVARLIRRYESDVLSMQVLKILSEYEFISWEMLGSILGEDFDKSRPIISELSNISMIEFIGSVKENLRLNDAIRDYVQRSSYKLDEKYRDNLKKHVRKSIQDYTDDLDRDISDYVISTKEALKHGVEVPSEFLIPSHFVNAMRDLYNNDRRFDEVVLLADRILKSSSNLDERIIREIRYWLCLSLARKRDERFLAEVQEIQGADHNFLMGFYYRLIGRQNEALQRFTKVLSEIPNYYRAKRELIQVYLNLEEFELAFDLAKETYFLDKNNPYNIQSYFRCLLKLKGISAKQELLDLLQALKSNISTKADEMYKTSLTQYYFQIENDILSALDTINTAIQQYPKKIYPYLTKLEILNHSDDIQAIEKVLVLMEKNFDKNSDIWRKLHSLLAKCKVYKYHNQLFEMHRTLEDIKRNFSRTIYDRCYVSLGC